MAALGFSAARPGNSALAGGLDPTPPEAARLSRAAALARRNGGFEVRSARIKEWRDEAVRLHYQLNHSLECSGGDPMPCPMDAIEALVKPFLKITDPEPWTDIEQEGHRSQLRSDPESFAKRESLQSEATQQLR